MKRIIRPLILLSLALVSTPVLADTNPTPAPEPATTTETFSPANMLLFVTNHMQNMPLDTAYVYRVTVQGTEQASFSDDITLLIKQENNKPIAYIDFFTGTNKVWTPTFEQPEGNPILALYLQREIHQMERSTGGQWRHFQKQIKLALENNAQISDTNIDYKGKSYTAKQVTIHPYQDDPYKDKLKKYLNKAYQFVLAPDLPGQLYSISATLKGDDGKLIEDEHLVLQ